MPAGTHPDRVNRIWPYWKNNITGGQLMCQEHTFRTSGDIRNSWARFCICLFAIALTASVKFDYLFSQTSYKIGSFDVHRIPGLEIFKRSSLTKILFSL